MAQEPSASRVVIVGCGFGGVYVARQLLPYVRRGDIALTVVNKTNFFLFTPLLHEVATGGLTPTSVTEPLREIFADSGIVVCQGETRGIDRDKKIIYVGEQAIAYDYAVIATGATTNYYGVPGAEENAYSLKSLADAVRIRDRVIDCFERAMTLRDEQARRRALSFAVVGGGATGVELAAELLEFSSGMTHRYRATDASVTLINASKELLATFEPKIRDVALRRLRRTGVDVLLEKNVTQVMPDKVLFADGGAVEADTIIWAAGVKPQLPDFLSSPPRLVGGRIAVDDFLRVEGDDSLFVLGDAAALPKPLPMLAQVAVAQADTVAANIIAARERREPRAFVYRSKGSLVSIGQWFAAGTIFNAMIHGRLAWWAWRTIYLFKFLSWKKRVRIAFEWTVSLFNPRDITKVG